MSSSASAAMSSSSAAAAVSPGRRPDHQQRSSVQQHHHPSSLQQPSQQPIQQRLRAMASYTSFRPHALACSGPIQQCGGRSYSGINNNNHLDPQSQRPSPHRPTIPSRTLHRPSSRQPQQQQQQQHTPTSTSTTTITSFGALAGPAGMAVFAWTAPHIPLLILSHVTADDFSVGSSAVAAAAAPTAPAVVSRSTTTVVPSALLSSSSSYPQALSSTTAGTCLAFSPVHNNHASELYLASSTRGSGILVWDVSGHSLSPLQGRLGMELASGASATSSSVNHSTRAGGSTITSLTWMTGIGNTSNGHSYIAATTATSAAVWDLRQPVSHSSFRPSIRLGGVASRGGGGHAPYFRQIACHNHTEQSNSNAYEIAILDAAGMVRIYDLRCTTDQGGSIGTTLRLGATSGDLPLHQFEACQYAGVGLSSMPLVLNEHDSRADRRLQNGWVTWGFDTFNTDAVVKIWMDDGGNTEETPHGYRLVGQCTTPNLACARVCPSPVNNSIVTVGFCSSPEGPSSSVGWKSDLWKVHFHGGGAATGGRDETSDHTLNTAEYGVYTDTTLDRIATFQGPGDADAPSGLSTVLGSDLKTLRAAELVLSSLQSRAARSSDESDCELLLCCLTENGFVSTHAIPEASPLPHSNYRDVPGTFNESVVAALAGPSTKIYPANSELPILDAAQAWGKPTDVFPVVGTPLERNSFFERHNSALGDIPAPVSSLLASDSGAPPFDSNAPSYYISAGSSGLPHLVGIGEVVSPPTASSSTSLETDTDDNVVRDAARTMARIDTDRIPCPRLCGASFSSGVGGMAIFNNGGVKRMWRWWEKSDPTRVTSVPGFVGEQSLLDSVVHNSTSQDDVDVVRDATVRKFLAANCPRTLKDLLNMTDAAKVAQWGAQEASDVSSTEFPVVGSDFFDDESDGSSDSGEIPMEEPLQLVAPKRSLDDTNDQIRSSNGTPSDMLTPTVVVTDAYNELSLCRQSPELAVKWKLGDFDVGDLQLGDDNRQKSKSVPNKLAASHAIISPGSLSKRVLPSYRSLLPSTHDKKKSHADAGHKFVDYESVHGGEHSVRPNMQESMIFLRKLFTHQQQQDGNAPFPNLLSPPDGPLLPRKNKPKRNIEPTSLSLLPTDHPSTAWIKRGTDVVPQVGVYTLRVDATYHKNDDDDELETIEENCWHNAKVCKALGDFSKMQTWTLVAQLVQSRMKRAGHGFDGWGGATGGALGVDLVRSLFRFYESLGDVQMLSSLVCVLRGKHGTTTNRSDGVVLQLLPDQNARYDFYIRRYAELLYGWRLLAKRAELLKHLVHSLSALEIDGWEGAMGGSSGIDFAIECPRCTGSTHFGYCRSCNDYSFRCALCDNGVRGLFSVCNCCGHGGHVTHVTEWFEQNDECPTGCGCHCKLEAIVVPDPDARSETAAVVGPDRLVLSVTAL